MSNIYIQEPPTNGKVCLKTTVGDIDIELWSKECPKASRNFVQLCVEDYYNGTIFHRVVPGFIVQGGDPTGSGMGGESVYGEPFKDEFHSRLKFVRRGLVAMANGGPNDNGSQFFFTLDKTPDLQGKHTIFGKVVGNTLYNMLKLGECEVDKNERPFDPHKIFKTEVLSNPFPDIVPRKTRGHSAKDEEAERQKAKAAAVKAEKNFNLLSFGDEAEEDEEVSKQFSGRGKSAHDILNDEKLSAEPAVRKEELYRDGTQEETPETVQNELNEKERIKQRMAEKLRNFVEKGKRKRDELEKHGDEEEEDLDNLLFSEQKKEEKAQMEAMKEEYKRLQKEIAKSTKRGRKDNGDLKSSANDAVETEVEKNSLMASIKAEREKYTTGSKQVAARKTGDREKETLALLERFKAKMDDAKQRHPLEDDSDNAHASTTGKPLSYLDDEEDPLPTDDWLAHKFVVPEEKEMLHEAKDANVKTVDSFDIYDPRNPMNKRRREKEEKDGHRGNRERRDHDRWRHDRW